MNPRLVHPFLFAAHSPNRQPSLARSDTVDITRLCVTDKLMERPRQGAEAPDDR